MSGEAEVKKMKPEEWPHGTPGCYTNHYCRCEKCREANTLYCKKLWAARKAKFEGCANHVWHLHGAGRVICGKCGVTRSAVSERRLK